MKIKINESSQKPNYSVKTKHINFDDDLVIVYDGDKEIYRGIEDYEPMKDEDWRWDDKIKGYKFDKFIKYCLDV